jgi:hypothetical protein
VRFDHECKLFLFCQFLAIFGLENGSEIFVYLLNIKSLANFFSKATYLLLFSTFQLWGFYQLQKINLVWSGYIFPQSDVLNFNLKNKMKTSNGLGMFVGN